MVNGLPRFTHYPSQPNGSDQNTSNEIGWSRGTPLKSADSLHARRASADVQLQHHMQVLRPGSQRFLTKPRVGRARNPVQEQATSVGKADDLNDWGLPERSSGSIQMCVSSRNVQTSVSS